MIKTVEIILLGKDKVSGVADKVGGSLSNLGGVAMGIAAGGLALAGTAVVGLGVGLAKLAIDAAPVEGIGKAFEGLTESIGVGTDDMLDALKRGSAGMITNRDLMESFNKAASLVSTDFATKLPDAMKYLGKVSAATGTDMSYLLDSLVLGVGRLSPKILDNLNIQVDLTKAVEDWALTSGMAVGSVIDNTAAIATQESALTKLANQLAVAKLRQGEFTDKTADSTKAAAAFRIEDLTAKIAEHRLELGQLVTAHGKTSTSTEDMIENMSKAQQQEALMAQVMELLAKNTADLPDITDNATTGMARLKATFQDIKDEAGMALIPVLNSLMGVVESLMPLVDPVIEAFKGFVPILEGVAGGIQVFVDGLMAGEDPLNVLSNALCSFLPAEIAHPIINTITAIRDGIQTVIDVVTPYITMAAGWIGQNIKLSDVLIALGIAIASVVVPALISAAVAAAPVVATALALIAVVALLRKGWETDFGGMRTKSIELWGKIKPIFKALGEWLGVKVPEAIEILAAFWKETLWPALQAGGKYIKEDIFPVLKTFGEWLGVKVPEAIGTLTAFWKDTLWPALQAGGKFIKEDIFPVLSALGEVIGATLVVAGTALAGLWQNVLWPALKSVGTWISTTLGPIMDRFIGWLSSVTGGAEGIRDALKSLATWLSNVADKIRGMTLPKWLTPGSPTPLELGIKGIGKAFSELPSLNMAFQGASAGGGITIHNHFGAGSVRSDEDIYRMAEAIAKSAQLKGMRVV